MKKYNVSDGQEEQTVAANSAFQAAEKYLDNSCYNLEEDEIQVINLFVDREDSVDKFRAERGHGDEIERYIWSLEQTVD